MAVPGGQSKADELLTLVCRNSLDVFDGFAGIYGSFHGNLRKDGVESVLKSALENGGYSDESLYFSVERVPFVHDLAHKVGNAQGQKIHLHPPSMRWYWLDLAPADHRKGSI